MTLHYNNYQPFGAANGRNRAANQAASGNPVDPTSAAYLGAAPCAVVTHDPPIEDAGIRAGELIGYRAWLLLDGLLHGMFVTNYVWMPGAIEHVPKVAEKYGPGLHAFKDMHEAVSQYDCYAGPGYAVVFGEVSLWGEVIEHELGYRSEYAAIRKLTALYRMYQPVRERRSWKFWKRQLPSELTTLRRRYGLDALALPRSERP